MRILALSLGVLALAVDTNCDDTPALVAQLQDGDPIVRIKAAYRLKELKPEPGGVVPALTRALGDTSWPVRWHAAEALGNYGEAAKGAIPALRSAVKDGNLDVSQAAAVALWQVGRLADEAVPPLMADFKRESGDRLNGAARGLQAIEPAAVKAVPELIRVLKDPSSVERRQYAAEVLGSIGPQAAAAVPALLDVSEDASLFWRGRANEALKKINAGGSITAATTGPRRWAPIPHGGEILSLAFSPDGKTLVTATGLEQRPVRIWDTVTGRERAPLPGDLGPACGLAFSPDGKTLVTANSTEEVSFWDAATGAWRNDLTVSTLGSHCVAFSPDGTLLAAGSRDDHTTTLWDLRAGKLHGTLAGHKGYVECIAFAPDGKTLASSSNDRTIRIWDTTTVRELDRIEPPDAGFPHPLAYSPDGKTLASGSVYGGGVIRLWDVPTRGERARLVGHLIDVRVLAFAPDGKTLASGGSDNTVRLWDTATGKPRKTLTGHEGLVTALAFSPDGKMLVSGSADATVRIWDQGTGEDGGKSLSFSRDQSFPGGGASAGQALTLITSAPDDRGEPCARPAPEDSPGGCPRSFDRGRGLVADDLDFQGTQPRSELVRVQGDGVRGDGLTAVDGQQGVEYGRLDRRGDESHAPVGVEDRGDAGSAVLAAEGVRGGDPPGLAEAGEIRADGDILGLGPGDLSGGVDRGDRQRVGGPVENVRDRPAPLVGEGRPLGGRLLRPRGGEDCPRADECGVVSVRALDGAVGRFAVGRGHPVQ